MFTHLHVHTEFSLLDGLPRINPLVEKAKEHGMTSLAITDHGVMYGAHKFSKACRENEIKPIIGCEMYVAPRKHTQKMSKLDDGAFHLVLLAKNREGYQNLIRLVSLSHMEGFYYRPRIDKELLAKYSAGLIGLSACLAGELSRILGSGNIEAAKIAAESYQDIFGKDNFYIEIQRNNIPEQAPINELLLKLAADTRIPVVATTDAHYINKEDALAQEVLMCISTGRKLEDTNRLARQTDEFYLKSEDEMKKLFSDLPEALKNTEKIQEMCEDYSIGYDSLVVPEPPIPESYKKDYNKCLHDLLVQRAKDRLGHEPDETEKKRLEYEFDVISKMGYSSYILMNEEFASFLKKKNIPFTTRGSAAGSFASYILGIVTANPLKFQIPFERFLYMGRPSSPDIDIDVASSRREEVIEHVIETYGKPNVAHIITFGRMQARGSIRDAGRVLGLPLSYVDRVAKLVPPSGQGLAKVDINKAIQMVPELAELIKADPDAKKLIDTAKRIEGVAKSQGIHACGILVTPGPIIDYCPVIWDKSLGPSGRMITQYEMDSLEELKLLKVDFLGLTGLDTIAEAKAIIKRERDIEIKSEELPLDDEATYKLIRDLDTNGIFQLETDPMKNTSKILQPENIFDISASIALVRPGPNQFQHEYADRKAGRKPVTFLDARMKSFLSLTYGLLVYQEDIMQTVVDLAGMTWAEADKVRKFTGKKKPEILFDMKDDLLKRFQEHGMPKAKAEALFELFVPFTNYAFNKPHAASYALVVYQTAYLKAHYPVEYMAAQLKSEIANFDKIASILNECTAKGIKVLPPDVNKSKVDFSIEDKHNIRFGLAAIKNLGKAVVEHIINARDDIGREFANLDDFLAHIPLDKINEKALTYLIKVGAFDKFGERNALLATLPNLYEKYRNMQVAQAEGQLDIFAHPDSKENEEKTKIFPSTPLPQVDPANDSEKIEWEKELLGLYLTVHPLSKILTYLDAVGAKKISEVKSLNEGARVQVGGIVSSIKRISTKKDNKSMAFVTIEDQSGSLEVILFPATYAKFHTQLVETTPMIFLGKVNVRDGERSLICDSLKIIDSEAALNISNGVRLRIPPGADKMRLKILKEALKNNPGSTTVTIQIPEENGYKSMQLKQGINVNSEIQAILDEFKAP